VTITKNKAPTINSANTIVINENTVVSAATILDVNATDPETDPIKYALTDDGSGTFAIDEDSGIITVANNTLLDAEGTPPATIEVTASDDFGNVTTQKITVTVNDLPEDPAFSKATYNFVIAEDGVASDPVGMVGALDEDLPMQTLTFSVDDDSRFTFVGTSNVLILDPSLMPSDIDFETAANFDDFGNHLINVDITVTDSTGRTDNAVAVVEVTNVAEAPVIDGSITNVVDFVFAESDVNGANPLYGDEEGNTTDATFTLTFAYNDYFAGVFDDPETGGSGFLLHVDPSSTINDDPTTGAIADINFDGSNNLVVTFNHLASAQDRALSNIKIYAEDGGGLQSGLVSFDLGVTPAKTVDIQYVNVISTTSHEDSFNGLSMSELPSNQEFIAKGESFFTEIWVTSLIDPSTVSPGRPHAISLASIEFDLGFDQTQLLAVESVITEGFVLGGFTGLIDNGTGTVERLAANVDLLDAGLGLEQNPTNLAANGNYVRVGYVEFQAISAGTEDTPIGNSAETDFDFTIANTIVQHYSSDGNNDDLIDSEEVVDHSQLNFNSQITDVVNAFEFTIDIGASNVTLGGDAGGTAFTQQIDGPDMGGSTTLETGSIFVRLDDINNPTKIQLIASTLDLDDSGSWSPLTPPTLGDEGVAGNANANFGLGFLAEDVEVLTGVFVDVPVDIAVRDAHINLSSSALNMSGDSFDTSTVNYNISSGSYASTFSSVSLAGESLQSNGNTGVDSELAGSGGNFTLTLNLFHENNISDNGIGINLDIGGAIVATFGTGAPLQGSVTAEEGLPLAAGTGLFTTVTKEKTDVGADAQVSRLPKSENWVNEWEGYWVEVWGNTAMGPGISSAKFDLSYNTDYFSATEFEYSSAFNGNGDIVIDDAAGSVTGISGSTELETVGGSEFVLIGRVRFESLADDHVDMGENGSEFGPKSLGIEINSASVGVVDFGRVSSGTSAQPETEVWAVPYDINDDDKIGLADLTNLIGRFGDSSFSTESDALAAALDFDNSGSVGLADLTQMISNFGLTKGQGGQLEFPATFTQMWIGQQVDTTGPNSVEEIFETALQDWQAALGMDEVLDVQLVVKDFGNGQLGEAQLTSVDEAGLPSQGILTIDDDANGVGWSSDLAAGPSADQYDLYTVMLHELGHLHGFMNQYTGFQNVVTQDGSGNNVIVTADGNVELDYYAQHLDNTAHAGDLLNDTLDPGVRKGISDLDVQLIQAAYAVADSGSSADASAAALHAAGTVVTSSNDVAIDFALSNVVDITEVSGSTGVAVVMPESTRKELSNNGIKVITSSLNSEEVTGDVNQIFANFEYRDDNSDLELVADEIETLVAAGDVSTEADDMFADWDEFEIN
ncbi:MAG: hypothetical protein ACKVH8_18810, partial [Pirellulales bacterium]